MGHDIRIPKAVTRLLVLAVLGLVGALVVRELPGIRRYLKSERM